MANALIIDRDGVLTYWDLVAAEAFFRDAFPRPVGELEALLRTHAMRIGQPTDEVTRKQWWTSFWEYLETVVPLCAVQREKLRTLDACALLRVYEDARPALIIARTMGVRVGVLSNFALAPLAQSLHQLGLSDAVDVSRQSAELGALKPAPEAFLAMAQLLSTDPADCLVLDDRPEHVAAARKLGMQAFRVNRNAPEDDFDRCEVKDLAAIRTLLAPRNHQVSR